ncbi:Hypothetical predicted protein [Mytilus galloprovincialis]|uniref:Uncharacterized protein n=1 Tax=Mytilus galloprovincialis TaxID=29158 RepID=A0A8B6GAY2_MYTGA|nr:Hypothetical predicted protein [Mytilus galloprovincialis]
MQRLRQIAIGTCIAGFLVVLSGVVTPGWLIFEYDRRKLEERSWIQRNTSLVENYSTKQNLPKLVFGTFYMRICYTFESGLESGTVVNKFCVVMLLGHFINMAIIEYRKYHLTGILAAADFLHLPMHNTSYTAIVVVCSLTLILSFVSLVLTLVYNCKRYPQKRLGVIGSISLIMSGTATFLFAFIYLIMYGHYTNLLQPFTGVFDFTFPYSPVLCIFGSIMYFICASILIKLTIQSKGQFNYEMMVIDTSQGGRTYIAKT